MSARRGPSPKAQQSAAENWNRTVPVGCRVKVKLDDGSVLETLTESQAWVLGGHTAVVTVKGISGGYLLSRCTPDYQ